MKRLLWLLPVIVLCLWMTRQASGYWYFSQDFTGFPFTGWYVIDGSLSTTYYSPGGYGGLTGNGYAIGNGINEGEVKLTVRQASGTTSGAYAIYADFSGYFNLEFYLQCGTSSSSFRLYKNYYDYDYGEWAGTQVVTASGPACHDNMILRAAQRYDYLGNPTERFYVDNTEVAYYYWQPGDGEASSGETGVGVWGLPTGSVVSHIDIGSDTTAPNAVSASSIGISAYTNHVDLQWPASSDDSGGSGVFDYEIWRNGSFIGSTGGTTFSDTTVSPNNTYQYTLNVVDFEGNTASTNFNVATAHVQTSGPFPSVTPEGRRVGVRPTGAYWGAGNENIDVLSGNLNFTLPLLKAQARSGWGAGFNLNYNSQNWRNDSGGNWEFGHDVGYGFGWRLMAGAITPVFSDPYTISYYLYTDSTGAEYRLDQNSGNVWTSQASIYISFDASMTRLHFRDGSFWDFGCVAASSEADAGVMYPTLMEDSNGNQVLVRYQTSPGANWTNSSSRITEIEDTRAAANGSTYRTYNFTYNGDTPPHLTAISNSISDGEGYTFSYLTGQAISAPFNSQSYGTTTMLRDVTVSANNTYHEFTYNGSGELTEILLPYKGYLAYDYTTTTYSSSRSYREVVHRYLSKDGISQTEYPFSHESSPGPDVHQYTILDDPGGVGEKYWAFATSGFAEGLATQYQGRQLPGPVAKVQNDYTWTQDGFGNSYLGSALITSDPGQSYAAAKKTSQTVDGYGNVTQVNTYDYGNLTTPLRTDNYTYLNSSGYTSRYIFNRVATTPTATITYDQSALGSTPSDYREWDSSVQSITARGNPTTVVSTAGTQTMTYNFAGGAATTTNNGVTASASTTNATNYTVPSQVTVGSLSETMTYNSFLGLTNETDPNGGQVSLGYDALARPYSTTSPFGATTINSYSDTSSPPTVTTTVNNARWTKTTMDGLGRAIKVEAGHDTTTESVTDTEYDSCGCSPAGKMKRTTLPHAPGATQIWTTYTYDGIGRTLTATTAGTETTSTTSYSYQGNTVTVTDAVGNWKKFTMDALGQLLQVNEPNPAGGSDYVATYAYDTLGHLISVSMPRPSGTQTRTFNYGNPPGAQLLSATNPENGTVTYVYNSSDKTLTTKTDAKNQQVQYTYDSYKRVTQVKRGTIDPNNNNLFTEDACQRETYSYDTNPYDGTFSTYTQGRLAAVQYKGGYSGGPLGGTSTCNTTFTEMYSYSQAGGMLKKRLSVARTSSLNLDAVYTYDNEGRVTATQYPSSWNGSSWVAGPNLSNTYDSMGRLQKLTDVPSQTDIVSGATYNPAGQLLTMSGAVGAVSESRTYNSIGQLTQLSVCTNPTGYCGGLNIQYAYSATQNNGKITSETDAISGEQISYTYDSLNRLASATSSVNPGWGQSYAYDGFGNLTNQTVTKGTAPSLTVSYDPATNRRTGESADANGNICSGWASYGTYCPNTYSYDVENRMIFAGGSPTATPTAAYSYAPGNKRVWRGVWSPTMGQTVDEVTFWGANGQKLTTYQLNASASTATATGTNQYFGSKLIKNATGYVYPDHLGSIGKYFPYGQERPSATADGTDKFATYFRDSETGLDYAKARYHQPGMGRFMTPDSYRASAGPGDPGSWNRYAYTRGDPVNRKDSGGTCDGPADTNTSVTVCADGGGIDPNDDCIGTICPLIDTPGPGVDTNCFAAVGAQPSDPLFQECFGAVTVTAPAPPPSYMAQSFAQAAGVWNGNKNFVNSHFAADKQGCQQVMQALGIDSTTWLGALNAETTKDGVNASNVTMVSLFANGTPQVQAQAAQQYGNQTVAAYLYAHSTDVVAVSQLGGSAVYINYSQVTISDAYLLGATALHEALHNALGLVDTTLETRLAGFGGRVGDPNSITSAISSNCFK